MTRLAFYVPVVVLLAFLAFLGWFMSGDDSYNCHDYAWRQSGEWLDDPTPFIEQAEEVDQEHATHVVYVDSEGNPIHSAKYLGDGWAESKFGSNQLMTHPLWATTYGNNYTFYKAS